MRRLLLALAVTAWLASLTPPADAQPPGLGCPSAYGGWLVWDVTAEPYHVDNLVDEKGNQDGWACALPINVVTDEDGNPFQLYNFIDNTVARP